MHFKGRLELEQGFKQIHLTPLINIMFLLLAFFMFTAGFLSLPGIKVNLPKTITSRAVQYENIEIVVTQDNALYLNGRAVTPEELKALFKQLSPRAQTLLIKADSRASLGEVARVWDMAHEAGLDSVHIVTNRQ